MTADAIADDDDGDHRDPAAIMRMISDMQAQIKALQGALVVERGVTFRQYTTPRDMVIQKRSIWRRVRIGIRYIVKGSRHIRLG